MSEIGVQRESSIGGEARSSDRPTGRRRSDRIVGVGHASQLVTDQAMAAARVDLPLLVTGPAGSGKEHISRAVHAWSNRAANPFVVVSCGAVNATLLGREIFGCAAGVYSLLQEAHVGALTRADSGTLLLEEIGKLPDGVRSDLVTAIKQGTFQPEGGLPAALRCARESSPPLSKNPRVRRSEIFPTTPSNCARSASARRTSFRSPRTGCAWRQTRLG